MSIHTIPDSYTKLLIHSNHSNSSTDIVDSSASNHTITRNNSLTHSTSQAKFGASSLNFSANPYLTLPASSDWDVGAGDFTVDFWWYPNDLDRVWWVSGMQDHNFSIAYKHQSSNKIEIWASSNGSSWNILGDGASGNGQTPGGEIVLGVWQHIAVVRQGGTKWFTFHNGIKVGDFTTAATALYSSEMDDGLRIGIHANIAYHADGYIDEFRWSKGIARWNDSFVPPNKPYSVIDDDFVTDIAGIEDAGLGITKLSSNTVIKSDPNEASGDSLFSINTRSGNTEFNVTNTTGTFGSNVQVNGTLNANESVTSASPLIVKGSSSQFKTYVHQADGTFSGDIIIDIPHGSYHSTIYRISVSGYVSDSAIFEGSLYMNPGIFGHVQHRAASSGDSSMACAISAYQNFGIRFTINLDADIVHPIILVEIASGPNYPGDMSITVS